MKKLVKCVLNANINKSWPLPYPFTTCTTYIYIYIYIYTKHWSTIIPTIFYYKSTNMYRKTLCIHLEAWNAFLKSQGYLLLFSSIMPQHFSKSQAFFLSFFFVLFFFFTFTLWCFILFATSGTPRERKDIDDALCACLQVGTYLVGVYV